MKKVFYFAALVAMPAMAQQTTVATLEDTGVEFNDKGYWNGGMIGEPEEGDWGEDVYHCTWQSGLVNSVVDFNDMDGYSWWGGIALSQSTSTDFVILDDQDTDKSRCGVRWIGIRDAVARNVHAILLKARF